MSKSTPLSRGQSRTAERSPGRPIARHGRLRERSALRAVAGFTASALAVGALAAAGVLAFATLDVFSTASSRAGVRLLDAEGNVVAPKVGAPDGAFNVLLAGSDSGGGNPAYDIRGGALNDVTMLLHVSADHKSATVISFPRDLYVPIPSCPDPTGGAFEAMGRQKLNTSLSYGGLTCTVLTVSKLTGLEIAYAGVIEFDGVIEMSNAIGGVPVCVGGDIRDDRAGLDIKAGENVLQGSEALAFLRTRYGVGDGSDLARISNQQVFLSSLVRTIRSADTLANPVKVYALAKAAVNNISLSDSLKNMTTLASLGIALKDIDIAKVVFVQYPNHYEGDGVAPTVEAADLLMSALKADRTVTVTGDTGLGSELKAGTPATSKEEPTAPGAPSAGNANPDEASLALPSDVLGQTAADVTCSTPYFG
jgi:LCP family protein required for cell wall assembly